MAENKAIMPMADYTAICDAVREKKGTADTYKSGELATAISGIPSGGYTGHVDAEGLSAIGWTDEEIARFQAHVWWDEEDDDLWSVATNGEGAFPKNESSNMDKTYTIAAVFNGNFTNKPNYFKNNRRLKYVDLTGLNLKSGRYNMFQLCSSLSIVVGCENLFKNASGVNFNQLFAACPSIYTIDIGDNDTSNSTNLYFPSCGIREIKGVLDLSSSTNSSITGQYSSSYGAIKALVKAKIKNVGVSYNVSNTILDHESLLYLLDNLQEKEGLTLTLGEDLLSKLTDDEKAIAINKGWTLA